jgi:hypothetical protein
VVILESVTLPLPLSMHAYMCGLTLGGIFCFNSSTRFSQLPSLPFPLSLFFLLLSSAFFPNNCRRNRFQAHERTRTDIAQTTSLPLSPFGYFCNVLVGCAAAGNWVLCMHIRTQ